MGKFQAHKDVPDEVWLQIGYGDEGEHTWAPHEIAEDGIEEAGPYVRADRLSGRVTVKAKPLQWIDQWKNGTRFVADWGTPPICLTQDGSFYWGGGNFPTVEAAKAAAQADFEARILAALDTASAPSPDQIRIEALREAAEVVRPRGERPCDCESCYCSNPGDAQAVADWDAASARYNRILDLITGGDDAHSNP